MKKTNVKTKGNLFGIGTRSTFGSRRVGGSSKQRTNLGTGCKQEGLPVHGIRQDKLRLRLGLQSKRHIGKNQLHI